MDIYLIFSRNLLWMYPFLKTTTTMKVISRAPLYQYFYYFSVHRDFLRLFHLTVCLFPRPLLASLLDLIEPRGYYLNQSGHLKRKSSCHANYLSFLADNDKIFCICQSLLSGSDQTCFFVYPSFLSEDDSDLLSCYDFTDSIFLYGDALHHFFLHSDVNGISVYVDDSTANSLFSRYKT